MTSVADPPAEIVTIIRSPGWSAGRRPVRARRARSPVPVEWLRLGLPLLIGVLLASHSLWAAEHESASPETVIWLNSPAKNFTESSPMGNGRLAAMLFGGVDEERIVLNESSVWSGSRQDADRPDAKKVLPEIRRLLIEGKNVEAEALVNANFTCKGPGSDGGQYGCYQVLGNLHLTFQTSDTNRSVTGYRRELNLNDAVTRMQFHRGDIEFTREMFVSAPDQVMVLRLAANRPGQISFVTTLDRPERFETVADGNKGLLMTGQLDNGVDGKGVRYGARVRILNRGGELFVRGNALEVQRADEVVVLITAATDYQGFAGRQTKDPAALTLKELNQAADKPYDSLRKRHVADYQSFFQRVSLQLGPVNPETSNKPIPERRLPPSRTALRIRRSRRCILILLAVTFLISSSRTRRPSRKPAGNLGGRNQHAVGKATGISTSTHR